MLDAIKAFVMRRIVRPDAQARPAEKPAGPSPIQLAACALLLELAHADNEFSDAERTHIELALQRILSWTNPPCAS